MTDQVKNESKETYSQSEVVNLLKDLFKYLEASDDSCKTQREKFSFFMEDRHLNVLKSEQDHKAVF